VPLLRSEWTRKQEISYKTARKWYKEGSLHVLAYQTPVEVTENVGK